MAAMDARLVGGSSLGRTWERAYQPGSAGGIGAFAALTLLGWATGAAAQTARVEEFSAQRMSFAPGPRNYVTTRGLRVKDEQSWTVGLVLDYARAPVVVDTCRASTPASCSGPDAAAGRDLEVVEGLAAGDLLGSWTPIPRLQLGLRLPVGVTWGTRIETNATLTEYRKLGLGDPEVEAKYRAVGEAKDPVVAGFAAYVTAPLGHATAPGAYLGSQTAQAGLRVIVDGAFGPFGLAANLGGVLSGDGRMDSSRVGREVRYSAAIGVAVQPAWRFLLDGFGSTRFTERAAENAVEVDGAVQHAPGSSPFGFLVGYGVSPVRGLGAPAYRLFAGFGYRSELLDRDDDGIDDRADQCPDAPEDLDGFEDSDGCPDLDDDHDGIPDRADRCPREAEDRDGFEDVDGCPDPDNDGDGVPDVRDHCPNQPETDNGVGDADGCPDVSDRDGDGVQDQVDRCPDEAEDRDGFEDTDGCPDIDNDKDGIIDSRDACPNQPETLNDTDDEDGCPDQAKQDRM